MSASLLNELAKNDGARAAAVANAPYAPTIAQTWDAARRVYFEARGLSQNGETLDPIWAGYVNKRGGLPLIEDQKLANEALAFFRGKRAEIDAAAVAARKAADEIQHTQRTAQANVCSRQDWLEHNLPHFFRIASELRAIADEIEAAKGTRATSAFIPGLPPIADDAALIALAENVSKKLTAAGAVARLVASDAAARIRSGVSK